MAKFKCIKSVCGTTIRIGAVVEGDYQTVANDRFKMTSTLNNKCNPLHVGGSFPMVGELWKWEEVK